MEKKEFKYLNANTSCRKANLIVPLIIGKNVNKALENLDFSDKKASSFWKKLIKSALGFFDGKDLNTVIVAEAYTGPASTLKRGRPSARLHFSKILKRRTNLYIKLGQKEDNGK